MADCGYCGEPVVWSKTAEGKTLPRSAAPSPRGICWYEKGRLVFASKDRQPPASVKRFMPHFIVCEGYKAKKRLERLLRGDPECSCQPGECGPACVACVGLELGRPCLALGVPESSR